MHTHEFHVCTRTRGTPVPGLSESSFYISTLWQLKINSSSIHAFPIKDFVINWIEKSKLNMKKEHKSKSNITTGMTSTFFTKVKYFPVILYGLGS